MTTERGTYQQTGVDEPDMDRINREYTRDRLAIGVITFAAILMMIVGSVHVMLGIAAIIEDELFVIPGEYAYEFNVTTWGWVHIGAGAVVFFAGILLLTGTLLGRIVGIVVAILSMIINFMALPSYPVWSTLVIAIDAIVIWAITMRGGAMERDFS